MVLSFGYFLMLFICCLSIVSIAKKQVITEEVNEALSISIRNTMEFWKVNKNIDDEEMINNFSNIFLSNINSDSNFDIYFYDIDTDRGLLDVEVVATFKYPNFRVGKVIERKTMIYDEKMN